MVVHLSNFTHFTSMVSHLSNMISSFLWCDGVAENPTMGGGLISTLLAATLFVISLYVWLIKKPLTNVPPLPPGPPGLPLLGNLPFLKSDLHRHFAELSETYGPIMKLQLGRKLCVVISSSSLAKQALKDHDVVFSNRDPPIAGTTSAYGGHDIAWSPNGPEWRKLRKIFVHEMMSKTSLDACHAFRRQEVRKMVKEVYAKVGSAMDIGELMFITILSLIMSMLWGDSLHGEDRSRVGIQFRQVVDEVVSLLGAPNVSDLFPVLARFDFQGVESKMKKLLSWFDRLFESLIDSRNHGGCGEKNKDFLGLLLEMKQKGDDNDRSSLSMNQVKALLMDIVVGGTQTTSTTLEWAMAELLQHPEIMRKACVELEEVVGKHDIVEESHLPKLHYLDAILRETFRLRPPLPLLVSRSPCTTQTISKYTIPKGSRVLFNVWAMQRDPEAWENPLEFQPERFLRDAGKVGDYRGNNFDYLPFGAGRRICPGINLAEKMLLYALATLLHSFEWKLPEGTKLDLSVKFGLVLKKQDPLVAIPTAKLSSPEPYC